MRNLLTIVAAALLAWLVGAMVVTRLDWLQGPTVIGTVVGDHPIGRKSRSLTHRFSRASSEVVRYQLPPDWPINPGGEGFLEVHTPYRVRGPALGRQVQVKLSISEPLAAVEYSLAGIWRWPALWLFLGSGVLLMVVFVGSPAPKVATTSRSTRPGSRKPLGAPPPHTKSTAAPPRLALALHAAIGKVRLLPGRRGGVVLLLLVLGFLWRFPSLLGLLGAALFSAILVVVVSSTLFELLHRFLAPMFPMANTHGQNRPGASGWLVDLIQYATLTVMGSGFMLLCGLGIVLSIERITPAVAWSTHGLNFARTLLWLPQDFDYALCAAVERSDTAAGLWLARHGARVDVVCEGGDPPITAGRLLLDDPRSMLRSPANRSAALVSAAMDGEHAEVARLLQQGASPDSLTHGVPLLLWAAWNHDRELIGQLLVAGADPNHALADGGTVLTALADVDQPDLALIYLAQLHAAGGNLDTLDGEGRTVLLGYSMEPQPHDLDAITRLLALGANSNILDRGGRTALDHLRAANAMEAANAMVARGARSGRVQAGGDALAVSLDSKLARRVSEQLLQFSQHTVAEWRPDLESLQLSAYAAEALRRKLPVSDLQIRGWATAQRASVTVCGRGTNAGDRCIEMELRNPASQARSDVEVTPLAEGAEANWTPVAIWAEHTKIGL